MKRLIVNMLISMFFLAASSVTGYSQEYRMTDQMESLILDGESKTTEIGFKALEDYNYMKIKVAGYIKKGEMYVELVDPYHDVRDTITVKSGPLNWDRFPRYLVHGVLEQVYQNPISGNWFIRISSKDAEGELRIFWSSIYNPAPDLLAPDQFDIFTIPHFR